ncbi:hypothetical protein JZ751_026382 [Albula glossodonta]|uniref:Uncharacterized protein n=1 Tax=Albula glossodonta TaxID=121402 RepID=A0A8T2PCT4_9TELE|nr:hypothetical protein JZ751_026382 [Albula glossodonta]
MATESENDIEIQPAGTQTEKSKREFVWTQQATWLLLRTRLSMDAEFNRPVCKMKKLWAMVAEKDVLQLYLELQERKMDLWMQQKALEERKIEAINNLARAISSLAEDRNSHAFTRSQKEKKIRWIFPFSTRKRADTDR